MLGCGGGAELGPGVGTSRAEGNVRALEMSFRSTDGAWVHLGDLRGRPVLLFLMATFDGVSQAALRPLGRFVRRRGDELITLGVAVQPNPQPLLVPYVSALSPPFPFVYQVEGSIGEGTSPLGALEAIPTFIMIDAHGVEVDRHVGFPNTRTLDNLLDRALRRGGLSDGPRSTPLIGTTER